MVRFIQLMLLLGALAVFAAACGDEISNDPTAMNSPTVAASASPTASPTQPPPPTKTTMPGYTPTAAPATPTPPPELVINEATFEIGAEGSLFLDLLSRVPDTPETRATLRLDNVAAAHAIVGMELPELPISQDSLREHTAELSRKIQEMGLAVQDPWPFFPVWPEGNPGNQAWDPYPHVHISMFMAEQSAFAGSPPHQYEPALGGRFDPAATDAKLAECDCDQPDINEYSDVAYYSWGEEGLGATRRRFDPPIYDHIGRGPRLLVGDGFAYYSIFNDPMEGMIDATQGNVPSLADSEAYVGAVRWLEGMGTIGTAVMLSGHLQIDEIAGDFDDETRLEKDAEDRTVRVERNAETTSQGLTRAPLLLPFSLAAGAMGHDGERQFTGFVLAHDDQATAAENLERLTARIRDGAIDGRLVDGEYTETPVADLLAWADLQHEGRFVVARIYQHEPHQRFFNSFAIRSNAAHSFVIGWSAHSSVYKYQLLAHE